MNSPISFLVERFLESSEKEAIVWEDKSFTYGWFVRQIRYWSKKLNEWGVKAGNIVLLEGDFTPNSMALFLSLVEARTFLIPLTKSLQHKKGEFCEVGQVELYIKINEKDFVEFEKYDRKADHQLYLNLRKRNQPGLVLFSSGSTGKSKAALHDLSIILDKFKTIRPARRTITFLLYDHIGGVNTMLHTLSNTGCIVTLTQRDPDYVLHIVNKHNVQALPASPTFLNLILLSEAWKKYDLSSLELVTYGTEPMPKSTLERFHEKMPHVRLLQTYGLSELGILRSKSRANDSLWVKIGGEGFKTRVVSGMLEIHAHSAMLGYLNAPSPFSEDGWFKTGDEVEVDGEWLRILGRRSEIINVGGEKVYPVEVESVLQEIDGVVDATVRGEKNPITGMIVCAIVQLNTNENLKEFRVRMRELCLARLKPFQVPVKVEIVKKNLYGDRFKKNRKG